jgi:beta-lactam-binding protein with PASTA domain
MKILIFLLSLSAAAEVYQRPLYQPDENHLPDQEVQEQEEEKKESQREGQGYRENQEEVSAPNDYTQGTDRKNLPRTRR